MKHTGLILQARTLLSDGKVRSTNALAAELFPLLTPEYDLQGVYKALAWLAIHDLADCARRGEPVYKRIRRKDGTWVQIPRRPWEWALYGSVNSDAKGFCPHCGGKL